MVCMECGKVKNRIEDFYNLSLTVKDIKSVYESLDQLVKGDSGDLLDGALAVVREVAVAVDHTLEVDELGAGVECGGRRGVGTAGKQKEEHRSRINLATRKGHVRQQGETIMRTKTGSGVKV